MAGHRHFHPRAEAGALRREYDRLCQMFELVVEQVMVAVGLAILPARPRAFRFGFARALPRRRLEVDAGGKIAPLRRDDHTAEAIVLDQPVRRVPERSEEHTSELQSLMRISYAVFCLKKKTNNINLHTNTHLTPTQRIYTYSI